MGKKCQRLRKTLYIVGWSCTGIVKFLINNHTALSIEKCVFNEKNALTIHLLSRDCQGVILFK